MASDADNAKYFIGCKLSLISKSDIRYEGTLYSLDHIASTVSLSEVRSFGTETRRPDNVIPPRDEVYEYIIFRGTDIKDLVVCEPPRLDIFNQLQKNELGDPAIIQVTKQKPNLPPGLDAVRPTAQGFAHPPPPLPSTSALNHADPIGARSAYKSHPVKQDEEPNHPQGNGARGSYNAGPNQHVYGRGQQRRTFENQNNGYRRSDPNSSDNISPRGGHGGFESGRGFRGGQRGGYGGARGGYNNYQQPVYNNRGGYGGQQEARRQPASTNQQRLTNVRLRPDEKVPDFDLAGATQQFEAQFKNMDISDPDTTKSSEEAGGSAQKEPEKKGYEPDQFYDNISCESMEKKNSGSRVVGKNRHSNEETFGGSSFTQSRSFLPTGQTGGYRSGYSYNRGYNRGGFGGYSGPRGTVPAYTSAYTI